MALEVPQHYLGKIKYDFDQTEDRKTQMLSRWLKLVFEPSWLIMIIALRKIGEDTMAKRIARKYGEKDIFLCAPCYHPVVAIWYMYVMNIAFLLHLRS